MLMGASHGGSHEFDFPNGANRKNEALGPHIRLEVGDGHRVVVTRTSQRRTQPSPNEAFQDWACGILGGQRVQ